MTELRERARKQRAELEKRMMGEGSDEEEEEEKEKEKEEGESNKSQSKASTEDSGCSWGMGEPSFWLKDYTTACHVSSVLTFCCVGVNVPPKASN